MTLQQTMIEKAVLQALPIDSIPSGKIMCNGIDAK